MKRSVIALGSTVLALVSIACGSSGESAFGDGSGGGDPYDDGTPGGGAALPEIGPTGTASACVTEVASAELAPTNLVFVFDKSGSMGDEATGFDPSKRWNPVKSGMEQFFADPYSATLRASLNFFPLSDDTVETACSHPYASPVVALTVASDPAFVSALETTKPSGGTPTLPAIQGAIAYAKDLAKTRPGEKTAVVLVTDGEPGFNVNGVFAPGCSDNTVDKVVAAAEAAKAAGIPVYVIGAGTEKKNMDLIAAGGGTSKAFIVSVNDPTATSAQFTAALADIRSKTVSCTFDIPAPPKGAELDKSKVNVIVVKGSEQTLVGYSQDCSDATGWQYDNPDAPTRIKLCAQACSDAQKNPDTFVKLAYGCKTQPGTGPR